MSDLIPRVVGAVHALALRAKADDVVETVLYGPTPRGATRGKTLAVFVGSPGATSRPEVMQGYDGVQYAEFVDVNCNAVSWSGGTDVEPHNAAVFAILADIEAKIDADPTLGGVCERATLGAALSAFPVSDSAGASVELAFTIRALAYT